MRTKNTVTRALSGIFLTTAFVSMGVSFTASASSLSSAALGSSPATCVDNTGPTHTSTPTCPEYCAFNPAGGNCAGACGGAAPACPVGGHLANINTSGIGAPNYECVDHPTEPPTCPAGTVLVGNNCQAAPTCAAGYNFVPGN